MPGGDSFIGVSRFQHPKCGAGEKSSGESCFGKVMDRLAFRNILRRSDYHKKAIARE
jgi:hypothetical protein